MRIWFQPFHITDELAVFLGKEKGSQLARTDVLEIRRPIVDHNLPDLNYQFTNISLMADIQFTN
jgi:hypothetical protein